MNTPPYTRATNCPGCGSGVYVQAEEHEVKTMGGRLTKTLRPRTELVASAPALMSACRCPWLLASLGKANGGT